MSRCLVVAGLQWGDEGKGKVTDLLGGAANIIARFQGGANAGHTVVVDGEQVILHQVPSGILRSNVRCVIGPGVVLDPETLIDEIDSLSEIGRLDDNARLLISHGANMVLPYHKAIDELREKAAGSNRIGTTGRGIGPTYEDMVGRRGVRLGDYCDPDRLARRLDAALPERNQLIEHLGGTSVSRDELMDRAREHGRFLREFMGDSGTMLHNAIKSGSRVLFESAQGTLLDVMHGTYPFVTSSMTTAQAAFPLSGVGRPPDSTILGVVKAYTTRVGSGPFPTEDHGAFGTFLQENGAEFGATTGRPRRCGALDIPALRYAVRINGVSRLALTKLDVLSGLDNIRVCVSYRSGHDNLDEIHPGQFFDPEVTPVYEDLPGFNDDISGARNAGDLPDPARDYLRLIASGLDVDVSIVSTGSDRNAVVFLEDPWK